MGRHERELSARAVEMTEVARQLRLVRRLAGLTYDQLAQATGLSTTKLYRAANGWRTPWPVVEAFVRGCGADPGIVHEQWRNAMSVPAGASFDVARIKSITTFTQLREAMHELRIASGLSLRELSLRAGPGMLPRSTLSEALRGLAPLREDLVKAFVQALRLGPEQEAAWGAAWDRASRTGSAHQEVFQVGPSPHLLRALSDLALPEWHCLTELVDSALDRHGQTSVTGSAVITPLKVSIDYHKDTNGRETAIVVRDRSPGMDHSELLESVRLGWTRSGSRFPSGFGFNVATWQLGHIVTVRTARREAAAWSVLTLDLRTLTDDAQWNAPMRLEPKQRKDEHGTEITIRELRNSRPRQIRQLRDKLGDIYSYLIQEGRLRLTLNGRIVAARLPCAWDSTRTVQRREGPVSARQDIDVTLATVQHCQDCSQSSALDATSCRECGSRRLVPLPHRVWGWLGVQRYLHSTDYGIDFYRNGRKILVRDKSLFSWSDDDTGETHVEYPVELPSGQGRIIGEIHCDHVPVTWTKNAFVTDSSQWRGVVRVVRGQGPLGALQSKRLGYPLNTSPLAMLFRAYRRNDPGLRYLIPGDGMRAIHDRARKWGHAFHQAQPAFQSDQLWYDAAAAHDAQRLGLTEDRGPDEALIAQLLGHFEDRDPDDVQQFVAQQTTDQTVAGMNSSSNHGDPSRRPRAVVRCEYLYEREARTTKQGRVRHRTVHQRLRVSNIGTSPADHLRIDIEPVGDGNSPTIVGTRKGESDVMVERLLDHTHIEFPVALTLGTAPQARLTARWEEDGEPFEVTQFINWM
jgi:ribosomal protein L40E/lambda repressor-like predicted transcriptional regulator